MFFRLEAYNNISGDKESHMDQFQQTLSELEKFLLQTQELLYIRGKRGRCVPVLIPGDTK
jgi:hypothetical protein